MPGVAKPHGLHNGRRSGSSTAPTFMARTCPWSANAGQEQQLHGTSTMPFGGQGVLTADIIEEHYRGYDQGSLIGLHAISPECTCKWFLVDIDQHGEDQAALAEANTKAALGWYADLQQRGFHPLLLDSNGRGGYHLLVVLSEPVASQRVHAFATQFVQDYAAPGPHPGPGGLSQAA